MEEMSNQFAEVRGWKDNGVTLEDLCEEWDREENRVDEERKPWQIQERGAYKVVIDVNRNRQTKVVMMEKGRNLRVWKGLETQILQTIEDMSFLDEDELDTLWGGESTSLLGEDAMKALWERGEGEFSDIQDKESVGSKGYGRRDEERGQGKRGDRPRREVVRKHFNLVGELAEKMSIREFEEWMTKSFKNPLIKEDKNGSMVGKPWYTEGDQPGTKGSLTINVYRTGRYMINGGSDARMQEEVAERLKNWGGSRGARKGVELPEVGDGKKWGQMDRQELKQQELGYLERKVEEADYSGFLQDQPGMREEVLAQLKVEIVQYAGHEGKGENGEGKRIWKERMLERLVAAANDGKTRDQRRATVNAFWKTRGEKDLVADLIREAVEKRREEFEEALSTVLGKKKGKKKAKGSGKERGLGSFFRGRSLSFSKSPKKEKKEVREEVKEQVRSNLSEEFEREGWGGQRRTDKRLRGEFDNDEEVGRGRKTPPKKKRKERGGRRREVAKGGGWMAVVRMQKRDRAGNVVSEVKVKRALLKENLHQEIITRALKTARWVREKNPRGEPIQDTIKLFMGDEGVRYEYNNQIHVGIGWTAGWNGLRGLRDMMEEELKASFNCVLIVLTYKAGTPLHADDEAELTHDEPVGVLVHGESRDLMVKLQRNGRVERLRVESGDAYVMTPGFQKGPKHGVEKGEGFRMSLSFRSTSGRSDRRGVDRANDLLGNPQDTRVDRLLSEALQKWGLE
jgi:hypothetical protein